MLWRSIMAPLLALLVIPLFLNTASAQPRDFDRERGGDRGDRGGDWELLGSTRIGGFGVDRDVIDVGRREGRFERIGLEAKDNDVFIVDVNVVYGNDEVQRIDVRQPLRAGQRTPPLPLAGRGRPIKRIEITARAGRGFRNRAVLNVYGEKGRERDSWELLGEQSVGFGVDRDVIRVGRREGRFSKIALEVKENDVEILDLTVFFNRGPPQGLRVRESIRAGGRTRPIDLIGGDRSIDRIELTYRARPGFRGRAKVAVFGLKDAGPPPPPPPPPSPPPSTAGWEELGCSKAGFLPDKDVIRVGRREGRFSQIQLRVRGNKAHILDLRVVYERGPPDDIPVRSEIRDGGETRPLDLRGERRAIDRVELVFSAQLNFKGSATICVYGR